jgi:hypothetical protein
MRRFFRIYGSNLEAATVARDASRFQRSMKKGYDVFLVLSQQAMQENVFISQRAGLPPSLRNWDGRDRVWILAIFNVTGYRHRSG